MAEKPVMESKHQLRLRLVDLHFLVGSWKLGEIAYVHVWLERSYDPPEGHPGQQANTLSDLWFVSYRRLSPQFQFSQPAAALDMYLYGSQYDWSQDRDL